MDMITPNKVRTLPELKLPRRVEDDLRRDAISAVLSKNKKPVWEESPFKIAELSWTPAVERFLSIAIGSQKVDLGIEKIEKILELQKRGLDAMLEKQGTTSAHRVSRLLITANDGSERLYRSCESLLSKHGDRLLMIRFDVPAAKMGEKIFGPDRGIKVIMVSDREHVENVLFALVDQAT